MEIDRYALEKMNMQRKVKAFFEMLLFYPEELTPQVVSNFAIQGIHLAAREYVFVLFDFSDMADAIQRSPLPVSALAECQQEVECAIEDSFFQSTVCYTTSLVYRQVLLLCLQEGVEAREGTVTDMISRNVSQVRRRCETADIAINAYVSQPTADLTYLSTLYENLLGNMKYFKFIDYTPENGLYFQNDPDEADAETASISEYAEQMAVRIAAGEYEEALACLARTYAILVGNPPPFTERLFIDVRRFLDSASARLTAHNVPDAAFLHARIFTFSPGEVPSSSDFFERIADAFRQYFKRLERYSSSRKAARIERVRVYILENISDCNLTVAGLSEHFGIHPSALSSAFKRMYGENPSTFIQRSRVAYAEELLQTTEQKLTEICDAAGFGSLSTMHRLFMRYSGTSPVKFRTRGRGERV